MSALRQGLVFHRPPQTKLPLPCTDTASPGFAGAGKSGVEIQAVRHGCVIHQREIHGITLSDTNDRTGHPAIECPGVVRNPIRYRDLRVADRDPHVMHTAGGPRRCRGIDRRRLRSGTDGRFAMGDVGGSIGWRRLHPLRSLFATSQA